LGTLPEIIVMASNAKWGRTLTHERDARLEELDVVTEPPGDAEERKKKLRALRGHITRSLAEEIQEALVGERQQLFERLTRKLGLGYPIVREAGGDTERQLAARMNTISELVVLAAHERFNRSASDELEHRIVQTGGPQKELRSRTIDELAVELEDPLVQVRRLLERGDVPRGAFGIEGLWD
jgi:hypothetical protein